MHFWIDKRSPQCGFGRSRVAASLHTGGSGLSFGHPPRRSLGHKSSSSSSANTAHVAANQTGVQVHRQPQQQYHGHTATTSTAAQYRSGGSGSLTTSNNNNNSNTANNHATNRNFNRSAAGTSTHHYYNNNRQQQLAAAAAAAGGSHHHHHHAPNSSNNNHNGTAQTLLSPTGNNLNCTPLNNATLAAATTAATTTVGATTYQTQTHSMHLQQQQQQQHAQRYRHPQFGNMSVRTMQPPQPPPQMNIVTATTTTPLQTLQQQQTTTNTNTDTTAAAVLNYNSNSILMTNTTATTATTGASSTSAITANQLQQQQQQQQSLDASLNTLNEHGIHHQQQLQHPHQSPNQTANLSAELYQTSPRIVTTFNRPLTTTTTLTPGICDHSSNLSVNQRTTYTNSTLTTMTTNNGQHHLHHQQQQQHTRHVRRTNRSIESTDLQFLPLHLKCGIFASLVLAIAFIVGIKVYFDNHGTKFEVGLFWLLTATFVFAFCFVSICKVPRVLFASASTSRSNSRDQTRDRCSMDEVAAANEANARGSMVNSIDDVVISGLHEFQQQEQIQSININAQAGPPPYHIAILLPETKAKEDISTMEESPPPSYDKILI